MKKSLILLSFILFSCSKSVNYTISIPNTKGFLPPKLKKLAKLKINTDFDKNMPEFYLPYNDGELYFVTDGEKIFKSYYFEDQNSFFKKDHIYTGETSPDYIKIDLKKKKIFVYTINLKKVYTLKKRRADCLFFQETFNIPAKTIIKIKVPINYIK